MEEPIVISKADIKDQLYWKDKYLELLDKYLTLMEKENDTLVK